jgi:hypothetical protein
MFGSVNGQCAISAQAGKYGIAGKIGQSAPPNPENGRYRPLTFGGSIASGVPPGSAGPPLPKELTAFNERPLPIAARGGIKVSCGGKEEFER